MNQTPANAPNSFVVSAVELTVLDDPYNAHFDLASQRLFGKRCAEDTLTALNSR